MHLKTLLSGAFSAVIFISGFKAQAQSHLNVPASQIVDIEMNGALNSYSIYQNGETTYQYGDVQGCFRVPSGKKLVIQEIEIRVSRSSVTSQGFVFALQHYLGTSYQNQLAVLPLSTSDYTTTFRDMYINKRFDSGIVIPGGHGFNIIKTTGSSFDGVHGGSIKGYYTTN